MVRLPAHRAESVLVWMEEGARRARKRRLGSGLCGRWLELRQPAWLALLADVIGILLPLGVCKVLRVLVRGLVKHLETFCASALPPQLRVGPRCWAWVAGLQLCGAVGRRHRAFFRETGSQGHALTGAPAPPPAPSASSALGTTGLRVRSCLYFPCFAP